MTESNRTRIVTFAAHRSVDGISVTCNVSTAHNALIEQAAAQAGVSKAHYVRTAALERAAADLRMREIDLSGYTDLREVARAHGVTLGDLQRKALQEYMRNNSKKGGGQSEKPPARRTISSQRPAVKKP